MAPVCKFWASGNCKFGDQCRFDHPPSAGPQGRNQNRQPQSGQQQNRFGLFDRVNSPGSTSSGSRAPAGRSSARDPRDARSHQSTFGITTDVIDMDLRNERPIWIMSAYGPGKDAPVQLFGGPEIEQSPEEIRCLHYQALATGNIQQSAQIEAQLAEKSNQQVNMVLNDLKGALQYLQNGESQHPNRRDVCESNTTHIKPNGPFSIVTRRYEMREEQRNAQRPPPRPSGFAQQNASAVAPQVSNTGFGSTSGFRGSNPSLGFGGGFDGPAGFAQQPAQLQAMSGSFGQPQLLQQPMGGNLAQQPQPNGFGNSPEAFAHQPVPNIGPGFSQQPMQNPSIGLSQSPMLANNAPFGMQNQQPALFGQPAGSQPNGMFGQQGQQQQQQPQHSQLPFGTSFNPQQDSNTGNSGFGGPRPDNVTNGVVSTEQSAQNGMSHVGLGSAPSGDVASYSSRSGGRLQTWKGRPVQYVDGDVPCYQRQDGGMERIWFSDGPPKPSQANSMEDVNYPETIIGAYQYLKDNGQFKDYLVPEIAPKLDMLRWDV